MARAAKSKWWPICWKCLRGLRLCLLLIIFIFLCSVIYLNEVGIPGFLKHRLQETLHARGVDLQFSRLRWRWYRGLVAEDVHFGAASETRGPQLSAASVAIKLNQYGLMHLKLKVDGLTVNQANLVWPLDEPGQSALSLSMTNIQTQFRFLTNDQWTLDQFSADFAGVKLKLSGSITNANSVRDWNIFHGQHKPKSGLLDLRLRTLAKTINEVKFAEPPELNVLIHGDAKVSQSFEGFVNLDAPGADTPWGILSKGSLLVHLLAATNSDGQSRIEIKVRADSVTTQWASTHDFKLNLEALGDDNLTNLVNAKLEVAAAQFITRWGQGTNAQFTAQWTHSLTNLIPDAGQGQLILSDARTSWGDAAQIRLKGNLKTPGTNASPPADGGWGWWSKLRPYALDWDCHLEQIHAEKFESQEVVFGGNWRAPLLTVTNLHTEMYHGQVTAHATLDVATRLAQFAGYSDFDVQQALPLFPPPGRRWFEQQQFTWQNPPIISGGGSITLPSWTNQHPDWAEIRPTLSLAGEIYTGAATYHTLPVTTAKSHLTYTNLVWTLPDLEAVRPEGKVNLYMRADDHTRDFYFKVHSTVDPKVAHGLAAAEAQSKIDWAKFSQVPIVDAEVWGRWHDYDRLGAKAHIILTNFSFRGEFADSVIADLIYTNQFVTVLHPKVMRSNRVVTADGVGFDIVTKKGFLTNGFSTMEPSAILHSLGPKIGRHVEPYHFTRPPTVTAYGVIPLSDDITVADLHFKVDGGTFEWLKFHLPHVNGNVDWVGEHLYLNDVHADFYGGKAAAKAAFDFRAQNGADFTFDTVVTSASLQALMADMTTHSNHLEGTVNGYLNVTKANSQDMNSWFGNGKVDLTDGLIWEFPVFGMLSPVLDALSPKLGESRASSASATFTITNSVIRSSDLEIRSPTVRLYYNGTVDFDTKIDATVEARVGKDAPIIGPLVSTVLTPFGKLFETKVTGTLTQPKQEPLHFVTRLFSPFIHPFHTLKGLFSNDAAQLDSSTNTTPATSESQLPAQSPAPSSPK